VLARAEGVRDESGRVVRVIGTNQDVTEARQAEEERRRLLARLYEALEGQHQRLAVDLHDGHVQSLAAMGLKLHQIRLRLGPRAAAPVAELLDQSCARAALVDCSVDDRLGAAPLDPTSRRPCSGSPSRRWPTSSSTPPRGTPASCSNGHGPGWSCGSRTTAAGSTSPTSRWSPATRASG
jgi:hypothetical protein